MKEVDFSSLSPMKVLGFLLFLLLIGFSNAQGQFQEVFADYYCPSNSSGCHGCSSRWDYSNVTSEVYIQENGKCKVIFYWYFEYLQYDSNPWLDFKCEYSESGESCNSEYEIVCASCQTYTISDIDVLYDPYVYFYDSCGNFYDMPLAQPCVNAAEETTRDPSECQGCSERWDYNNITSVAYPQENGKCTIVFSWNFEYLLYDSDPWLLFKCEYFENGNTCNLHNAITCTSTQKFSITDINILHGPHVYFYDSCGNYFEMPLTKSCVNALENYN